MFLDRKPFLYAWRPVQRTLVEGALWPFLARVKAFFFTETASELKLLQRASEKVSRQCAAIDSQIPAMGKQLTGISQHCTGTEARLAIFEYGMTAMQGSLDHLAQRAAGLQLACATLDQRTTAVHRALGMLDERGTRLEGTLANVSQENSEIRSSMSGIGQRFSELESRFGNLEAQTSLLISRLTALETEQRNQWNSMAKLLLCLYQQTKASEPAAIQESNERPLPMKKSSIA